MERLSWEEYRFYLNDKLTSIEDKLLELGEKVDRIEMNQATGHARAMEKARWTGAMWGGATAIATVLAKALWGLLWNPHK